jgi:hypothetical protein
MGENYWWTAIGGWWMVAGQQGLQSFTRGHSKFTSHQPPATT